MYVYIYEYINIHMFPNVVFPKKRKSKSVGRDSKYICCLKVALCGLKTTSNDSFLHLTISIQRDFTLGIRKRRPVVDTLGH